MTKEALKLALKALNTPRPSDSYPPLWQAYETTINSAITAIEEALAQPEQEPVAWFRKLFSPEIGEFFDYKDEAFARETDSKGWTPLYTTPPKLKPLTGWQPIETAPRDGTEILMTNGVDVSSGQWLSEYGGTYDQEGAPNGDGCDARWTDWTGGMQPDPTHWMPLPPPPIEPAQPEQEPVTYSGNGTAGREADARPTGFFFQMPKRTTCPNGMVDTCCENYNDCTLSFYDKDAEIKRLNERTRMNKEEEMKLRELAAGRCTLPSVTAALGPLSLWSKDGLDREIRKAVEAEREACAKLCEEMAVKDNLTNYYKVAANAIRREKE